MKRHLLIAGAGIGGLCAALAARAAGWDVDVYEQAVDPGQGAGTAFNLWGNAVTALDRVGLRDAVLAVGDPIESMQLFDHRGRQIARTPIGEIGARLGTTSVNIRRQDLWRLLNEACKDAAIPVHAGRRCRGYRLSGDGVTMLLADDTTVSGTALVGADGVRSAVRAQLVGDGAPVARSLPVRGISNAGIPVPDNTVTMLWGPRGGGIGCWPLGDGSVSWTVGTNRALRRGLEAGAEVKPAVLEFVAGFPERFRSAVTTTPAERIVVSPVMIRERAELWCQGPVALLGDAAHAMPTVFGQGACQALEDAVVLGEALAADREDPATAFQAYVLRRKPRMDWLRERVFAIDKAQKYENRLMCVIRDNVARRLPQDRSLAGWEHMMTFGHVPVG